MKKIYPNKVFAVLLSCALTVSSLGVHEYVANAEVETESMVASSSYNLALGKSVTANPSKEEGSEAALTDGKLTGQHAATKFGTAKTYYQVDLGQVYEASGIDQIVTHYKEYSDGDVPMKGYQIAYSVDGFHFETVKSVKAAEVKAAITDKEHLLDVVDMSDADLTKIGAVRYIRLLYPDSYTWGIQVTEIAVLDTDQNASIAEVEPCEDAAGVEISSPTYNTIQYNITAGENQEDYLYMVYLDGTTAIGQGVSAAHDYKVDGIPAGTHMVKVVAIYNNKVAKGITSEAVTVQDISDLISDGKNIANRNNNPAASILSLSDYYEGHTNATAQVALDGKLNYGEESSKALRTAAGSPQYFIVDLGDYYTPSEFEQAMLAYTNGSTYAAKASIGFSRDGLEYTEVGSGSGYQYNSEAPIHVISLDKLENYKDQAVRFVKVTLSDGVSGWGYVVNEFGLAVNTDTPTLVTPDVKEAAELKTKTTGLEKLTYTVVAAEGQEDAGYAYTVSIDGTVVNENAEPGTEYTYDTKAAGTYTVTAMAHHDGWVSAGISKEVEVDGYVNFVQTPLNLAWKNIHPEVTVTCDKDNWVEGKPGASLIEGAQGISAGPTAINDGVTNNHAHHAGYLHTQPGEKVVHIDIDLAKEYQPSDIHSVLTYFESDGTKASEYEISFSSDGENYERVFYAKQVAFQFVLNDLVDVSAYMQDTVRYVRFTLLDGNYGNALNPDGSINYGSDAYHICEIAVMGKQEFLPEKVQTLSAEATAYNTLKITWEDVADPDVVYNVYLNGGIVASELPAGEQSKTLTVVGGSHSVQIGAVKDGFEIKSDPVNVTVEEEPTTEPPTTTQAPTTTAEPTTEAPTTTPIVTTTATVETTVAPETTTRKAAKKVKVGKTTVKKVSTGKKKASVTLKKVKNAKGYQIKYAENKQFKSAKTKNVKKVKITFKKLTVGKVYYFKARAYAMVDGTRVYGAWSGIKKSKKIK